MDNSSIKKETAPNQPTIGKWDLVMEAAKKERAKKMQLEQTIAEAEQNGKESFDYQKFVQSYWRKSTFSKQLTGNENNSMIEHYKEEYYLEFPNVRTIEEFALELEKRDEALDE